MVSESVVIVSKRSFVVVGAGLCSEHSTSSVAQAEDVSAIGGSVVVSEPVVIVFPRFSVVLEEIRCPKHSKSSAAQGEGGSVMEGSAVEGSVVSEPTIILFSIIALRLLCFRQAWNLSRHVDLLASGLLMHFLYAQRHSCV